MRLLVRGISLTLSSSALAATAVSAATPGESTPQVGQLEEIIVTAERRAVDLQKAAQSVSVRSGEQLANEGKYSLAQILEDVPGMVFVPPISTYGSDTAAADLTIRGITSNKGFGTNPSSVAPATAVYVDGVYEGVGGGYDIDRVEILRGPQGTLYGRSATAGLVAIHTTDPDLAEFGGMVFAEGGNYSLRHYSGAFNAPLVDDVLAVRLSGNRFERDGYVSEEGGKTETTEGRIKVLYRPNDAVSLLVGAAAQDTDSNTGGVTVYLATPDSYTYVPTQVGRAQSDSHQFWAKLDWDLGAATLTYQPAYRSWNAESVAYIRGGVLDFDTGASTPKDEFTTHELRLASNAGSTLEWQVGALFYENELSNIATSRTFPITIPGGFDLATVSKDTKAVGIFGDATYSFTDSTRLNLGVRHDSSELRVNQTYRSYAIFPAVLSSASIQGDAGYRKYENTTFKVRLEQDLTPQNMLYAMVSSAFSPGDVSITGDQFTGAIILLDLEDETLTSYEIGSKNRFLGNRLQLNGNIYFSEYGGYQTADTNLTPLAPPTSALMKAPASVFGVELEASFQASPNDRIDFTAAYTDASWDDKSGRVTPTTTFADYYSKDAIPNVVPFASTLSYEHLFELGEATLSIQADVRYESGYYAGNVYGATPLQSVFPVLVTPAQAAAIAAQDALYKKLDDQVIGNFGVTWAYRNYNVTGYVRNVDDNDYKRAIGLTNAGWRASPYDPRTYGLVLSARW